MRAVVTAAALVETEDAKTASSSSPYPKGSERPPREEDPFMESVPPSSICVICVSPTVTVLSSGST